MVFPKSCTSITGITRVEGEGTGGPSLTALSPSQSCWLKWPKGDNVFSTVKRRPVALSCPPPPPPPFQKTWGCPCPYGLRVHCIYSLYFHHATIHFMVLLQKRCAHWCFLIGCVHVLNCLVWCKSMIPKVKCDDGMEVWYMMVSRVVCYEM